MRWLGRSTGGRGRGKHTRLVLLEWELNDPIKLSIFVLGAFAMALLLTVTYLRVTWGTGGAETITNTGTWRHWLITYPSMTRAWVMLAFLVPAMTVLTFRYDREGGYALPIYTLPCSKSMIFSIKLVTVYILSLLLFFIPLFFVNIVVNADVSTLLSVIMGKKFTFLYLLSFYFLNYSLAVSVLYSLLFRNSFLCFFLAFFTLITPFFAGLNVPPFSFVLYLSRIVNTGCSPMTLRLVSLGLFLPLIFLIVSWILSTWRDIL